MKGEWVFGVHAVTALLESGGEVEQLWFLEGRRDRRLQVLAELAAGAGIAIRRVTRLELDQIAGGGRHQGVAARAVAGQARDEDWLEAFLAQPPGTPFLLILDSVQDPHNLGACLRSANAAGIQAVIVPRDRAAGLSPTVRKVACGAAEATPLVTVTNLARTLRRLREAGVWLVGLAGEADQSLYDIDLSGPLGLVLGAEGEGMRRLTREHCDFLASLPMCGSVASLNVSVAAGICLYEALRQRQAE
ncbi:MAG: 23S rRNA (guanosine(2251)-2'-O)-methyltransferase RlmB [Gammaproteobacteria bacterium]|jgi:23S rRNA (guanosine2251-2'-O)-methyltransferase